MSSDCKKCPPLPLPYLQKFQSQFTSQLEPTLLLILSPMKLRTKEVAVCFPTSHALPKWKIDACFMQYILKREGLIGGRDGEGLYYSVTGAAERTA